MAWRRGQAYAKDLRVQVLARRDLTLAQATEWFGFSRSYVVSKVRTRLREQGDATRGTQHNHVPLPLQPLLGVLRDRSAPRRENARIAILNEKHARRERPHPSDAEGSGRARPDAKKSASGPKRRTVRT
jgi:hypothetical protein